MPEFGARKRLLAHSGERAHCGEHTVGKLSAHSGESTVGKVPVHSGVGTSTQWGRYQHTVRSKE